jgi:ADP-ribose pyrophosphatase YjhB (NUDIX family)
MARKQPIFAPRDVFEQMLEYGVMPTFDLVLDVPEQGILLVRRRRELAPYAGQWALPGLRQMKNERFTDTLQRIGLHEAGVEIDLPGKQFLGQFDGMFKTEHDRQDISTGYAVTALSPDVTVNTEHFSGHRFINSPDEIPAATGAMYRAYLTEYFAQQEN